MRVKTVVGTPAELVFHHDVPSVVREGRKIVCVNHVARRNREDNVQRFAVRVTAERLNVDPFMKPSIKNGHSEFSRIADESVLATLPGRAGFSPKITFDVLIK